MVSKINKWILGAFVLLSPLMLTSCLESGLDDIEDSDLCELSTITMEYRWITQNANGYEQMARQQMTLSQNAPDANNEIHTTVTVPSVSASFPNDVKKGVTLDGLYLTSTISAAAKIQPLGDAPTMGMPGHFEVGKTYQYQVTAANGKTTTYSITIDDFENFGTGTYSAMLFCRDVVYLSGSANPCDYTSSDATSGLIGQMAQGYTGSDNAKSCALWDCQSGDMAIFKVELDEVARYSLTCNTATRFDGLTMNVEMSQDLEALKDASNINPEHTQDIPNNNSWSDFSNQLKFSGYTVTEPGTYYIRVMMFAATGTGGTASVKFFNWFN